MTLEGPTGVLDKKTTRETANHINTQSTQKGLKKTCAIPHDICDVYRVESAFASQKLAYRAPKGGKSRTHGSERLTYVCVITALTSVTSSMVLVCDLDKS